MSEKLFKIVNDCGDYHLMNGDERLGYDLCSPAMRKANWNNVVDKLNEQEETIQNQKMEINLLLEEMKEIRDKLTIYLEIKGDVE